MRNYYPGEGKQRKTEQDSNDIADFSLLEKSANTKHASTHRSKSLGTEEGGHGDACLIRMPKPQVRGGAVLRAVVLALHSAGAAVASWAVPTAMAPGSAWHGSRRAQKDVRDGDGARARWWWGGCRLVGVGVSRDAGYLRVGIDQGEGSRLMRVRR